MAILSTTRALAQVSEGSIANIKRRYAVSINDRLGPGWSYPRTVMVPEEEVDVPWVDFMSVFRWGTHFIGLLGMLDERVEGLEEVHIAVSRDGLNWPRFPHRPVFLPRGPPGSFDYGEVRSPTAALVRGEQTYLYYSGNTAGQKANRGVSSSIGVARLRRGRWVGLRAGDSGGWVLTRELIVSGNRLELNSKILFVPYEDRSPGSKIGYIQVEMARRPADGGSIQPIPGFTLKESDPVARDSIASVVTWNGRADLSALRGTPVFVRLHFVSAEIYGMRFAGTE